MYGIQTLAINTTSNRMFENDVNMYGIQTILTLVQTTYMFENDVNMYGIQTGRHQTGVS